MHNFDKAFINKLKEDDEYRKFIFKQLINSTGYGSYDNFLQDRWLGLVEYEHKLGVVIEHVVSIYECTLMVIVDNKKDVVPLVLSFLKSIPASTDFEFSVEEISYIDGNTERKVFKVRYEVVKNHSNMRALLNRLITDIMEKQPKNINHYYEGEC